RIASTTVPQPKNRRIGRRDTGQRHGRDPHLQHSGVIRDVCEAHRALYGLRVESGLADRAPELLRQFVDEPLTVVYDLAAAGGALPFNQTTQIVDIVGEDQIVLRTCERVCMQGGGLVIY